MQHATQRYGRLLAIIALLGACGGHWVVLQSVAWTCMMVSQYRTSTLAEAVGKTFDGTHPCALCHKIEQGRKTEKKQQPQISIGKLDFLHALCSAPVSITLSSPAHQGFTGFCERRLYPPPIPPPRGIPG